jgi:hypothetical protein
MTSARTLFFVLVLLLAGLATTAKGADDQLTPRTSAGSLQNQVGDSGVFGAPAQDHQSSSGLFFLKTRPRLNLSPPTLQPTFAILNDDLCYTMRTYKVKRKEHFADGESGSRGYSTCELATNYQVRSAIAHPRVADDSRNNGSQK